MPSQGDLRSLGFRGGSGAGSALNRVLAPCGEAQGGQEAGLRPFLLRCAIGDDRASCGGSAGIGQPGKFALIVIADLLHDQRGLPLKHQQLIGGRHPHDFVGVHEVSGADVGAGRFREPGPAEPAALGIARRLIFEGFLSQRL
jgi:hypothetical protein